jgi:hypothetical protein
LGYRRVSTVLSISSSPCVHMNSVSQ